jgi:hypothetical protein
MNIDKKTIAIIVLSIALAVVSWIAYKPQPVYDNSLIEGQLQELKDKNKLMGSYILYVEKTAFLKQQKIDSLESLKPKIEIVYVNKFKEIDNASANVIASEFKGIFAKSNVK